MGKRQNNVRVSLACKVPLCLCQLRLITRIVKGSSPRRACLYERKRGKEAKQCKSEVSILVVSSHLRLTIMMHIVKSSSFQSINGCVRSKRKRRKRGKTM